MKRIFTVLFCTIACAVVLSAQDGSRLPLSIYVADLPQEYPENAKTQMVSKISRMLTSNGIASMDANCNFFITVVGNPVDKEIIPGAPAQVIQSMEFTFFIADAARQLVFSTVTLTSKGTGVSEAKSYLDAMKRLNVKSPEVALFLDKGKRKIINYYDTEAEAIFKKAKASAARYEYEAALYELCCFPTECASYEKSLELGTEIYLQYVDYISQQYLNKAKAAWAASQNAEGAEIAGSYLAAILPEAKCYDEAVALYNEIKAKVYEDWKWEMKKYQDTVDIRKAEIDAWKEIGVAYGQNQQPTTNYLPWLTR